MGTSCSSVKVLIFYPLTPIGPCEQWYHPKCMNVPDHMIETLQNTEDPWICSFCQSRVLVYKGFSNISLDYANELRNAKLAD